MRRPSPQLLDLLADWRKRGAFCNVAAYSRHVNLVFYYGAEMPDPHGLLKGKGKQMRHIRFDSPACGTGICGLTFVLSSNWSRRAHKGYDHSKGKPATIKSVIAWTTKAVRNIQPWLAGKRECRDRRLSRA